MSPVYKKLGYVIWLAMLAMSLIFYKERAFFMDAGFQLFNMINEGHIQIYHHRFVTAIPQIPAYLLLLLKAPLWLLAATFSASYILFFLSVYHLLVRYLKNIELGWVLIFLFTLISLDTFYHIQSEFYLGLSLLLLSFGLFLYDTAWKKKWIIPAQLFLLTTVAFSHKLTVIFFVFLWLFFLLKKRELWQWRYLAFLLVFFFLAGIKSIYFTNWYEAAKQVGFQNNFKEYFPAFHTLPSNIIFLKRCVNDYYMLPVFLVAVSVFYLQKKEWIKTMLVWSFTIGFILLYNISDAKALHRFYSEVTYLPLIIFVAVPFLYDIVPFLLKKINWLPALFAVMIIFRLFIISNNSRVFKDNFSWINNQLEKAEKMGTNRLLLPQDQSPADTVLMEWGVPFTAMHLSSLNDPKAAATILIMPEFSWYEDKMDSTDLFFSPFHKVFKNQDLNNDYYDLHSGKYREIK